MVFWFGMGRPLPRSAVALAAILRGINPPSPGVTSSGPFLVQDSSEERMLWESLVGIILFSLLVLFVAPEWWSSSKGVLKERQRKEKAAREEAERSKSDK
jgi:hypothetical protein